MDVATSAVITIGIDPTIELGPVTLAWHGLMIAIGILVGGLAIAHDARRRGLDTDPIYTFGAILVVGALVGGRLFFLVEHGRLGDPGEWLGTTGFTFYGGFIAAALGIALYLWRRHQRVVSTLRCRRPQITRSSSGLFTDLPWAELLAAAGREAEAF